jgi:hypothetical protein
LFFDENFVYIFHRLTSVLPVSPASPPWFDHPNNSFVSSFLGSTAQLRPWPPPKIRLNFLESSQQFSFLQGRVVSPTPNPHPGGPILCIYIPQRQGGPVISLGTHFSRLLRHAWVTVGLFLFPGHHTGSP